MNNKSLRTILKILLVLLKKDLKGYLRYKTITPQNVLSEAQVKNFLFRRKGYVLFS